MAGAGAGLAGRGHMHRHLFGSAQPKRWSNPLPDPPASSSLRLRARRGRRGGGNDLVRALFQPGRAAKSSNPARRKALSPAAQSCGGGGFEGMGLRAKPSSRKLKGFSLAPNVEWCAVSVSGRFCVDKRHGPAGWPPSERPGPWRRRARALLNQRDDDGTKEMSMHSRPDSGWDHLFGCRHLAAGVSNFVAGRSGTKPRF